MMRVPVGVLVLALCCLLPACATRLADMSERVASLLPADILLFGEQHDAPHHQHLQRAVVLELARTQQLAAVVVEMAEQGHSTTQLGRNASQDQVQAALHWRDGAWPWADYGPVIMAAVEHGVPVIGANLARDAMRAAMANTALDAHLAPDGLEQQRDNIRTGHCMLLPEGQIDPMARIQIARDAAMASTAVGATRPGKAVLLLAGGAHVSRVLGVPTHLPQAMRVKTILAVAGRADTAASAHADLLWETPALAPKDHCAGLEQRLRH